MSSRTWRRSLMMPWRWSSPYRGRIPPNHHLLLLLDVLRLLHLPLRVRPLLPHPLLHQQRPKSWSLAVPYLLQQLLHPTMKIRLGQWVEHYWLQVFCFPKGPEEPIKFSIQSYPSKSQFHRILNQNITLMKAIVASHPPIHAALHAGWSRRGTC